jgi:very-short-patch-repair endonuclease
MLPTRRRSFPTCPESESVCPPKRESKSVAGWGGARACARKKNCHEARIRTSTSTGPDKVRRQQPIGRYIVDFVCFEARLIVELDGERHDQPESIATDAQRTAFLENEGFRVLRFWNHDLDASIDGVLDAVFRELRR